MKFLKSNWKVLLLVIFTIASETVHELFVNMPFYDEGVNLDSPVYFLVSQIGSTSLLSSIIVFILVLKGTVESQCIAAMLIVWNIKEVLDEVQYMIGINTNVFEMRRPWWGQITLAFTVIGLSWMIYSIWKSSEDSSSE